MVTDTERALRDLLGRLYPGEETDVHEIICTGANYMSALFAVRVGSRSLFAKVANVTEQMRAFLNADYLYATELLVYSQLVPVYAELQRTLPLEYQHQFPVYYGGDGTVGKETVVMEDLRVRGFSTPHRLASVTWEQASSAMTSLATFHALSFALSRSDPKLYQEYLTRLVAKPAFDSPDGATKRTHDCMIAEAIEAVCDPQHKNKLKTLFSGKVFTDEYNKFRLSLDVPVICHGDYRPSNLLIKETKSGVETIVVDYQMVYAGSPAVDILYYVVMGTDQKFRHQHYDRLLRHYHTQLTLALAQYHIEVDDVYPWDTFRSEIKQVWPLLLMVSVVMLSLALIEDDRAGSMSEGDISQFETASSTLFQVRFDTLVQDCVAWGMI